MQPVPDTLKRRSRQLRREQTDVEKKLWYLLRDRRLRNYKFVRQKVIGNYIADFVCRQYQLIIELDGRQHGAQQAYDKKRDDYLRKKGYDVLRFWNNEILENPESAVTAILDRLTTLTPALSRQRERENNIRLMNK